jgi:hypothetical protein
VKGGGVGEEVTNNKKPSNCRSLGLLLYNKEGRKRGMGMLRNDKQIKMSDLFPEYAQLGAGMVDFFATTPFIISLIIISVITGICEEALHRGKPIVYIQLLLHGQTPLAEN